jgi:hypothetical protein
METILTTLGAGVPYMIMPDIQIHLDGRPILSYSYSVYKGSCDTFNNNSYPEAKLRIEESNDPNYRGYITIEEPGNLFVYTAEGPMELTHEEVQELIEVIIHYRVNPQVWSD